MISAPYMRWAKTRPHPTYDLAASGLMPVTTAELIGDVRARDAFDLSGNTDEGLMSLRNVIAARYGVGADRVAIASGASGANFQVMLALLQRGDNVVVERPVYDPLVAAARAAGATVAHFDRGADDSYTVDPHKVQRAITAGTKLIVLSNPHNPSGAMVPRDSLLAIGEIARSAGAHVLVDEVYLEARHDDRPSPTPAATQGDVFISTNSLTKAYGLAGLRSGWIIASPAIAARVREVRDVIDGSGPHVTEALSVIAFQNIERLRQRARAILTRNIEVLRSMARANPRLEWFEPEAGTTAFPRVRDIDDTTPFVDTLVKDYDTIVVPGKFFQAPEHIRVSFGGKLEIVEEATRRIDAALKSL